MTLVADASLVVDLLIDGGERGSWAAAQVASAGRLHAPHVLDLEVASALRRRSRAGELSARRAGVALDDLRTLPIERYPATELLERIWKLRDRMTPYDAAYVALAEALGFPLATSDLRLSRGAPDTVEIVTFEDM
jgi:predicted nucleic acid-binding protein